LLSYNKFKILICCVKLLNGSCSALITANVVLYGKLRGLASNLVNN
jgi:hypothetical protein